MINLLDLISYTITALMVAFSLVLVVSSCLCKLGIHRRIYGWQDGFSHDLFTNKVQGGHYSKTCECGKVIEVKPESKEFIDHFQEIEDAWLTEEHLIQERAMRNLLRGHEIDIVTAEPVHK